MAVVERPFYRQRSDFLLAEIVPSVSTIMGGAPIKSNRLGMRDREYAEIKPPNTYRIVFFSNVHPQPFCPPTTNSNASSFAR